MMPADSCVACGNSDKKDLLLPYHHFPSNPNKQALWFCVVQLSEGQLNVHFLKSVLHTLSVYRSASHFGMHGKVVVLSSTRKIRITVMSELHTTFKHIYLPLTYVLEQNTWLPEQAAGCDATFNQTKRIVCFLYGKVH